MKIYHHPTLADSICDLRTRKIKKSFFTELNRLLDWEKISKIINCHYNKGKSATGSPSDDGLLLFKMCLLQTWYGLSDYEVEDRINDSLSFSYFCGLHLEQSSPDHSTLSRFRTLMAQANAYEHLFKEINGQLARHPIIIKKGAIVDASVIETPLKPKGKVNDKDTAESGEQKEACVKKDDKVNVDKQGAWLKKRGKYYYGYKKHYVPDEEGLVVGVVTTKASVNEGSNLQEVLASADLPSGIPLKGDKGDESERNASLLKRKKRKNHILKKAKRGESH